jgi:hypothetical protein
MLLFQHKAIVCNVNNEAVGNWDEVITYLTALTILALIIRDQPWFVTVPCMLKRFALLWEIIFFQINLYYSQTCKHLPTCMLGKVCSVACVVLRTCVLLKNTIQPSMIPHVKWFGILRLFKTSTLVMGTEHVSETLVISPSLTWMITRLQLVNFEIYYIDVCTVNLVHNRPTNAQHIYIFVALRK